MICQKLGVRSRPGLRATEQFRHFHSLFHRVVFLRRVPDIWSLLGAIFALSRPESIWSMLYSFKRMLQIDFSARLLKIIIFTQFDTVIPSPSAFLFFIHSKPDPLLGPVHSLSFCLICNFSPQNDFNNVAIHYRSNDISWVWEAFGALSSVAHGRTDGDWAAQASPILAQEICIPWAGCRAPPLQYSASL